SCVRQADVRLFSALNGDGDGAGTQTPGVLRRASRRLPKSFKRQFLGFSEAREDHFLGFQASLCMQDRLLPMFPDEFSVPSQCRAPAVQSFFNHCRCPLRCGLALVKHQNDPINQLFVESPRLDSYLHTKPPCANPKTWYHASTVSR